MEYLGFSPSVVVALGNMLRGNIGSIASIALYIFMGVASVYLVFFLLDFLMR